MSPEGFEPAIPASERTQTYALDCVALGTRSFRELQFQYLQHDYFFVLNKSLRKRYQP